MKKRERKMESPKTNYTVWLAADKSLNASTAQEALKAALLGIGVQMATSDKTDEQCIIALHRLAKPMADGTKRIHRFSLPWNLRFDFKTEKLSVREVEVVDEVKSTGKLTKQTESALVTSVVKNHTKQIEDLNEALKSQVAEFSAVLKNQVVLNELVNKRLAALEAAVAALQKPSAPAKSSTKKAVVETGDLFEESTAKQPSKYSTNKPPMFTTKKPSKKKSGVDVSDLGF
jgi:polyhydroxyalkanoate synthesis regulator phasin